MMRSTQYSEDFAMNPLVDRYLLHVRSYLPRKLRDDVAAELEDSLRSRIEDEEAAKGEPLSRTQIADLLAHLGHPMLVAGRYLPRQHLIGPTVFPAYWYALKSLAIIFAVIAGISVVTDALLSGQPPVGALIRAVGGVAWSFLAWSAIMTLAFAAIEDSGVPFLDHFRPERLGHPPAFPPRISTEPISRYESLFDIVLLTFVLVWWLADFTESEYRFAGLAVNWSIGYAQFFYPVLALLILGLVRAFRNLARPYWTSPALAGRIVYVALWIGVLAWAAATPDFVTFLASEDAPNPGSAIRLASGLESSVLPLLGIWILIGVVRIAADLVSILRRRDKHAA